MMLLLFPLLASGAPSSGPCCTSKTVGGLEYTLVREDSSALSLSCLSPCVYERSGMPGGAGGPQYCFARGEQTVFCGNATSNVAGKDGARMNRLENDPMCGKTVAGQAECYFDCTVVSSPSTSGQVVRDLACLEDCFSLDSSQPSYCVTSLLQDVRDRKTCNLEGNPKLWGLNETCQVSSPDYVTSFVPSLTSGTCSSLTEKLLEGAACKRVIQEQQGLIRNTLTLLIQFSCVSNPFAPSFGGPKGYGDYGDYGNASDYDYGGDYGGDYSYSQRREKRGASWMVHDGQKGRKPGSWVNETGGYKTELDYTHTRHRYPWICSLRTRHSSDHLCAVTLLSVPPSATVMTSAAHCTLHCSSPEGEALPSCCCSSPGRQSCSRGEQCGERAEVTGIPAERLEVLCGEWQTGGGSDGEEYNMVLPVTEVTRHPDYSLAEGPGQGSDIAVLKVDDSQLEDYGGGRVFPACLPQDGRPPVAVHSGWSRAPPRTFLEKYAAGFLPYYEDFQKQWHYKMDIQPTCRDPSLSQTFGQAITSPSDSFYPSGSLCAKDFSRQSCFSSGDSGAPLMTANSETGRLHAEGLLSFVKGCDTFTIGAANDERTEWQLTQFSENPSVYVELACFLPWVAEQYGLTFPSPPSCSPARGDSATNLACTETISNLFSTEHPCIFPFYYEGRMYNECIQFDQDGFLLPVFRCPVRNITTKVDGVSAFTFLEPTHGYCLNEQGELDPEASCSSYRRVPPFSQCKNDCPGVRAFGLTAN